MGRSRNNVPKIQVALKLPRFPVGAFVMRARLILARMTGNTWFPSPPVSMAKLGAAIDALARSEVVRATRVAGSVPVRDKKRQDVQGLLERLAQYVETIANANLERAYEIVQSAGMFVKSSRGRPPVVFHAKPTRRGEVRVGVPSAGDRAGYEFQFSLDGTKTWQPFPQPYTNHTTVPLSGLTPGATVHFRYRVTIRGVTGNWIEGVSVKVE